METWSDKLGEREARLRSGGVLNRQETLELIEAARTLSRLVQDMGRLCGELLQANVSLSRTAGHYLNESIERDYERLGIPRPFTPKLGATDASAG